MALPVLRAPAAPDADFLGRRSRCADGATLACLFVVAQLLIPAQLVLRGIPLSLTPADVAAMGIGLCWLCAQFTTTLGVAKGRNPVRTALFVYAVAMLAAFGYATTGYLPPDELRLADHAAVLIAATVGLALGVCDGVRGRDRLDFVLKGVVIAGTVVSAIGICQFLFGLDLTRYMTLPVLRVSQDSGFIYERNALRRVAGTTGHPIEFGVLCSVLVPLAAHYAIRTRRSGRPSWPWWCCTAVCGAGLMFSVSRSAVLCFAAAGAALFLGWPARRRLGGLLACLGFLVVIKLAVPGLLGTFYTLFTTFGTDSSISFRTHDYDTAIAEIGEHFWLGRGVGTWYAPKHQIFDNQYLLSMVESGLVGVVTFAAVFLVGLYAALKARHLSTDPDLRDLGLTLAACMLVPLVGALTFDLLSFHTVTGLMFLLVGATGALLRAVTEQQSDRRRTVP